MKLSDLISRHVPFFGGNAWGAALALVALSGITASQAAVEIAGPDPDVRDYLGTSVAIDGGYVLAGAPGDDAAINGGGAVQVLELVGDEWAQTDTLVASDAGAFDYFGSSVDVGGNLAIVGAPLDDDNGRSSGSAYVFSLFGGAWVQQQKLSPASLSAGANFGSSVTVANGRLFVGAPGAADGGSVSVFELVDDSWVETSILSSSISGDDFGTEVSASGDRVAISAPGAEGNYGSVAIYQLDGGSWLLEDTVSVPVSELSTTDQFGTAVSLDGTRLAVGAPRATGAGFRSGYAYVFEVGNDSQWQQTARLDAVNTSANDFFATSLELEGSSLVVGVPREDPAGAANAGVVVEFGLAAGIWSELKTYKSSAPGGLDEFGASVGLHNGVLAAGIRRSDNPDDTDAIQTESGSVFITELADDTAAPEWATGEQLSVQTNGADFVELSWPAATDDTAVTGYEVTVDGAGAVTTTTTTLVIDGLAADTSYTFEVTATDAAGNTSSNPLSATATTSEAADEIAPVWAESAELTAVNVTVASVELTWLGATDDTAVVEYLVFQDGLEIASVETLTALVTNLDEQATYTFTIEAVDAAGNVSETGPSLVVTTITDDDETAPVWAAGASIAVSDVSATSATLAWPLATDDEAVVAYRVYLDGDSLESVTANGTVLDSLQPNTTYSIVIQAVDAAGNESGDGPSETVQTETLTDTQSPVWAAAAQLVATSFSESSIALSWDEATDEVDVVGYRLFRDGTLEAEFSAAEGSTIVSGLTSGTSYDFEIVAFDLAGNVSSIGNPTLTASTSAAGGTALPTWVDGELLADSVTETGASLSWSGASDDVGVVGYRLYDETSGARVFAFEVTDASGALSGLVAGTDYTYAVEAVDAAGNESTDGPQVSFTTGADTGEDTTAPEWTNGSLVSSNETDVSVELAWSGASDEVGLAGYVVYDDTSGTQIEIARLEDAVATGTVLTGLLATTTYALRVEAFDVAGNESTGGPVVSATTGALPDTTAPEWTNGALIAQVVGSTTVDLSFSGASDDNAIAGYRVYAVASADVLLDIADGSASAASVIALMPGTAYELRIEAYDAAGNESVDGPSVSFTTEASVDVVAPVWVSAEIGVPVVSESGAQLQWSGASDDVGVTAYRVLDATQTVLVESSDPTVLVTGVSAGDQLTVEAVDGSGNTSAAGTGPVVTIPALAAQNETIARPLGLSASDGVGESVSIDGDRAVVSAYRSNVGRGELHVYERESGQWHETATLEVASGAVNDNLGFGGQGVAIDGDTIVAGSWQADIGGDASGSAIVFGQSTPGVWIEEATLQPQLPQVSANFGRSVAIQGDIAVVGATGHSDVGRAFVFERSGTQWTQVAELSPSQSSIGAQFGFSVAISGNRIAIGANRDGDAGTDAGAVHLFDFAAGTWQESSKLIAADVGGADFFGESVSLNGSTLVVGAPRDDQTATNAGAAYVFEANGGSWIQTAKLLAGDGSGVDQFGTSVAVDSDVIAVGSLRHDTSGFVDAGAAYLFTRSGADWVEASDSKVVASELSGSAFFARSVDVSGSTILAGASGNAAAYFSDVDTSVFVDTTDPVWIDASLTVSDVTESSLALQWEGASDDVVVVGYRIFDVTPTAPVLLLEVNDGLANGAVLSGLVAGTTYSLAIEAFDAAGNVSANGPSATETTLAGPDVIAPVWVDGVLSAINPTENSVSLLWSGAVDEGSLAGYVVYDESSGTAVEVLRIEDGTATGAELTGLDASSSYLLRVEAFDSADNQSNDGPTITASTAVSTVPTWISGELLVTSLTADAVTLEWSGATDDAAVTSYRVFDAAGNQLADVPDTSWQVTGLTSNDLVSYRVEAVDAQGNVSANGPVLGGRFPFAKVIAPEPGDDELFGGAVAMDGDTAVISALHTDLPVNGSVKNKVGNTYVYERIGESWQLAAELRADDGFTNDLFGYDIDIDGDTIVIGAWHADVDGQTRAGAAYVFERTGSSWSQTAKLVAAVAEAEAEFGVGVAVDGDLIAVGAHEQDVGAFTDSGNVYLFARQPDNTWSPQQVLQANSPSATQAFGRSVAIDGDRLVVGAAREQHGTITNGGALYVFDRVGATWTQSARLVTNDIASNDLLGEDVDLQGLTIATVARDDDQGQNAGAGYIFEFDGSTWQQAAKLIPTGVSAGDFVGFRTSLSDGVVAIGSYLNKQNAAGAGAAYTFQRQAGQWVELEQYLPSDPSLDADSSKNDNFGISVALDGDTLLVGAEKDDHSAAEVEAYRVDAAGTATATIDSGSAWFFALDIDLGDTAAPTWPVASLEASDIGADSVTLTWSAADDTVGVNGYRVYRDGDLVADVSGLTTDVAGLLPVTEYTFSVQAYDLVGNESVNGPTVDVTTTVDTELPVWINASLDVSDANETGFTLDWDGASDNVGVDVYVVSIEGLDDVETSETSYTATGLTLDTSYTVTVQARDSSGNVTTDGPSVIASTTEDQTPPEWTVPTLEISGTTAGTVSLTWSGAQDSTGVTGYRLFVNTVAALDVADMEAGTLVGLTPETEYSIVVQALDAAGNVSTNGPSISVTTTADTSPPTWDAGVLTQSDVGFSYVELDWSGALDDSLAGYLVYQDGVEIASVDSPPYTVSGLSGSTEYEFSIEATDAVGFVSEDGPSLQVTTTADLIAPVWENGELQASGTTDRTTDLVWTGATDNDAVSGYNVYVDGVAVASVPSVTTSLTVNGLTPESTSVISVQAFDAAGNESNNGPLVSVVTTPAEPVNEILKLLASEPGVNDELGTSVAVSGNTLVAGAIGDDDGAFDAGAVYVYVSDGLGGYVQQQKLTASDPASSDKFGTSVAIDGDTLVVGMPLDDDAGSISGSAYVFTRINSVWTQQAKLVASDAAASEEFGLDVAIQGDLIAIGAKVEDADLNNNGAVYIYTRSGEVWSEETKILANDRAAGDRLGHSVDLSGNTLIASAIGVDGYPATLGTTEFNEGAAYIFVRTSPGVWEQQARLEPSHEDDADEGNNPGLDEEFAFDVAIDGDTAAIGARRNSEAGVIAGAVYVFKRSGSTWSQTAELTASDAVPADWLGYSVAIEGSLIIAGAWHGTTDENDRQGSVYGFNEVAPGIYEQTKYVASDAASVDQLGWSVALAGDTIIAGAPAEDGIPGGDLGGNNVGSIYLFDLTPDVEAPSWAVDSTLAESDATAVMLTLDWSGASDPDGVTGYLVYQDGSLIGETAGTSFDVVGLSSEVTYVFTVQAIDAAGNASLTGPSLTVTTPFGDSDAPTWVGGNLVASNVTGGSVDLSWSGATDNVAVVTYRVYQDDQLVAETPDEFTTVSGLNSTTEYNFRIEALDEVGLQSIDGPTTSAITGALIPTTEIAKLLAEVVKAEDKLGTAVAIHGNTLVASATEDDQAASGGGAVIVYERDISGGYVQTQKLVASDASSADKFGTSLAIQGDTLVVGMPLDDDAGSISGSAYVFTRGPDGLWAETQKLNPADLDTGDEFGLSVSIDGDLIAIGSKLEDSDVGGVNTNNQGAVYVFAFDGSNWVEEAKLLASDRSSGDRLGHSVDISGDTIITGAVEDDTPNASGNPIARTGSAYVFIRTAPGVWSEQQKLIAPDFALNDQFGTSVAIDGDKTIISAKYDADFGSQTGSVYIYDRTGDVWALSAKLLAADAAAEYWFGDSVAIDGNRMVVGASLADYDGLQDPGAVYVIEETSPGQYQQSKLVASDAAGGDKLGFSVAIFDDQVVGGAPAEDGNPPSQGGSGVGAVYVFDLEPDVAPPTWDGSATIAASDVVAAGLTLDWSGSTDDSGVTGWIVYQDGVEIGTTSEPVFTVTGLESETNYDFTIEAVDGAGNVSSTGPTLNLTTPFGDTSAPVWTGASLNAVQVGSSSASLSWSGATDNIGVTGYRVFVDGEAVLDVTSTSAEISGLIATTAYTVTVEAFDEVGILSSTGPSLEIVTTGLVPYAELTKLLAADNSPLDELGTSVSMDGNTIAAGAPFDDTEANNAGSVHIFVGDPVSGYIEQQKLTPFDGRSSDGFGTSVSLSGDTLVIGSPRDDDGGSNSGSAYVYVRDNGIWSLQQKLVALDDRRADEYGLSVSIDGDTIAIGAKMEDTNADGVNTTNQGAVYVYTRSGTTWSEQAKLLASDRSSGDRLGHSVSLSGDTIVAGAPEERLPNASGSLINDVGAAYVFVRAGTVWTEQAKLSADDYGASDEFGSAVAIDGERIVVGVPLRDDLGNRSGAVYVYERNAGVWSQIKKLMASDGAADQWFGYSVSISGSRIGVGAHLAETSGLNDTGALYAYEVLADGGFNELKFVASDAASTDKLGWSLAVDANLMVGGASTEDGDPGAGLGGSNVGALYVMDLQPDTQSPVWVDGGTLMTSGLNPFGVTLTWTGADDEEGVVVYNVYVDGVLVDQTSSTSFTVTGLGIETTYTISVEAVDFAGNVSSGGPSVSVTTPYGDTVPPTWVDGLVTVTAVVADSIELTWQGATDNEFIAGYKVFQDGVEVGDTSDTTFTVFGLAPETDYTFRVEAYDGSLLLSDDGPAVVGTTGNLNVLFEIAKILAPDGQAQDFAGFDVAYSDNTVVVGAPDANGGRVESGVAYVFVENGAGGYDFEQKLIASDVTAYMAYATSVDVSGDTIVIGAPIDQDIRGAAYVYTRAGGVWTETQKLLASDGVASDEYGIDVAIDGDTIVVGAKMEDSSPITNNGALYVYERATNGLFGSEQKLLSSDSASGDRLGHSVAISNDTIVAGAPEDDVTVSGSVKSNAGSVRIFERSGVTWVEEQSLSAFDAANTDLFGWDVGVDGDLIVVGAYFDDDLGGSSGSVYVYAEGDGGWSIDKKITASDGRAGDFFGHSVDVSGDLIGVGAFRVEIGPQDGVDDNGGAVYTYRRLGAGIYSQRKMVSSDITGLDQLGWAVSVSGDRVAAGAPKEDQLASAAGSVYVFDPDSVNAAISIAGTSANEGDSGTVTTSLTLTLSNSESGSATVDWSTQDGTGLSGVDYVAASGTATFISGVSTTDIEVSLIGDLIPEESKTFEIVLTNPTGAALVAESATVVIVNDDGPIPSMSIADSSINEGDAGGTVAELQVALDVAGEIDFSVDYQTVDGTAVAGEDFVATSGTLTIPAGETTAILPLDIVGDVFAENDDVFTVELLNPDAGLVIADDEASVTIVNDDGDLPVVTVASASVDESTGTTTQASVSLSLAAPAARALTVDWMTVDGTAIAGADYTSASGTATFAAGQSSVDIAIDILGDTMVEADETFTVVLSGATPETLQISGSPATVTIVSDDTQPSLSITDATVLEGASGTVIASLDINLFEAATQAVSVEYGTFDVTATAGQDYSPVTGSLIFAPGQTVKTVTFTVFGDVDVEDTESFEVRLSNATPADAELSDAVGVITITSDDALPVLSVADVSVDEGDIGATDATVTVSLADASSQVVTVDYATSDGTAIAGLDYTTVSGTLTFAVGATEASFTIPVLGDEATEDYESVLIQLSNATPAIAEIADATAVVTIGNDDIPPTLLISDASVTEGDSGTVTATVSLSLTEASALPVTIEFATTGGSATDGVDYTGRSGTVTFAGGVTEASEDFIVFGDLDIEGVETFEVQFSNGVNALLDDTIGVVTISNDDFDTYTIDAFAGMSGETGYTGDGGPADQAEFQKPYGIVADDFGNVFIADTLNHVIRKVDTNGVITTVAGTGSSGFSGDGGLAVNAQLFEPFGIEVDPAGNLYISDTKNNRIRKVDTAGVITTVAGTGENNDAGDGGLAVDARVYRPLRTRWHNGELYISDNLNAKIKKIDASGIITTVVGTGVEGYSGDGGLATAAKIRKTVGLDFDAAGNLWFADRGNHRIRKVDAVTGIITTEIGIGCTNVDSGSCNSNGFSGDGGLASGAVRLSNPRDLEFDPNGNMLIADTSNRRIRRVDTNGLIDTIAGDGSLFDFGDGGPADVSAVGSAYDLTIDDSGTIYFVDDFNRRARVIYPANVTQ